MDHAIELEEVRGLPLFRGLTAAELVVACAALRLKRFPGGANVLSADLPGEIAYIVLDGTLKVSTLRADGTETILALLGPGEIAGELALLDQRHRSADVVALEQVRLAWFDREAYLRLRAGIPRIADNLALLLARRLRLANGQIQALATLDVQGRVARQLLALAELYGKPAPQGTMIDLRLTQSDLAALCGATRVRVNGALGAFKRLGYIGDAAGHRLVVVDASALSGYAT